MKRVPGKTAISIGDFEMRACPIPTPQDGQLLVQLLFASVDPSHRASMRNDGYNLQNLGETLRFLI